MEKRTTLLLIISLSCGILVLVWFAWSQFTRAKEDNYRAAILKDLSEAARTYDSLRAHAAVTKKHYELYQAAIDLGNAEERAKTRTAWTISSEQECELEVSPRANLCHQITKDFRRKSDIPETAESLAAVNRGQKRVRIVRQGHYDKFRQISSNDKGGALCFSLP